MTQEPENRWGSFKKLIEDASPANYSLLLAVPVFFFVIGFLIWNIYLYTFGFVDNELIKPQFILAGIAFSIATVLLLGVAVMAFLILIQIVKYLWNKIDHHLPHWFAKPLSTFVNSIKEALRIKNHWEIIAAFSFLWLLFYTTTIFPVVPNFLGGGQPRAVALIANKETMPILNSLGIPKASGADYETANFCVVDQDSQGIYILLSDRVLMLDNSLFQGFGSLPGGETVVLEEDCVALAHNWSTQGKDSDMLLLGTELQNVVRFVLGQPLISFSYFMQDNNKSTILAP